MPIDINLTQHLILKIQSCLLGRLFGFHDGSLWRGIVVGRFHSSTGAIVATSGCLGHFSFLGSNSLTLVVIVHE